jgi:hypothetical protein
MFEAMVKTVKAPPGNHAVKIAPVGATVVRNAKTGQSVTVKGVGVLKGDDLKIKKGVSLLKPIAKQALMRRSEKRKTG